MICQEKMLLAEGEAQKHRDQGFRDLVIRLCITKLTAL